nr:hypothetical protein [uncultured Roseateles sp.]
MPIKKYIVRDGFMVVLEIKQADGSVHKRTYASGDEVSLDDDAHAQHAHKLEFANEKDRAAALATEKESRIQAAATNSPADLVNALIAALGQALNQGQAVPAPEGSQS